MTADGLPVPSTPALALRVVRALAEDTGNIVVLSHAMRRARQRRITRRQIELCCQRGTVSEGLFVNQHGHWQVNMFRHAAGETLTCAVAIDWPHRLLIITTF